ncbi:MAG TPA: DUF4236 domain-containing protein [candidate division Zixibacteria bacterium]|nr:DUF4236 domain-containing protein [candidate division Zixibacteria bacterium]
MGFYIRKSVSLGPIRINFSKSGVGISAGLKGARIGVDSRGRPYVHAGRHGIYYRRMLPGATEPADQDSTGRGLSWPAILVIVVGLLALLRIFGG